MASDRMPPSDPSRSFLHDDYMDNDMLGGSTNRFADSRPTGRVRQVYDDIEPQRVSYPMDYDAPLSDNSAAARRFREAFQVQQRRRPERVVDDVFYDYEPPVRRVQRPQIIEEPMVEYVQYVQAPRPRPKLPKQIVQPQLVMLPIQSRPRKFVAPIRRGSFGGGRLQNLVRQHPIIIKRGAIQKQRPVTARGNFKGRAKPGMARGAGNSGGNKKLSAEELDRELDAYMKGETIAKKPANKKKGGKQQLSAEELDRELEAYMKGASVSKHPRIQV